MAQIYFVLVLERLLIGRVGVKNRSSESAVGH